MSNYIDLDISVNSNSCLMKSGFARAKVSCLKYPYVLSARIDAKKQMDDTFRNTKIKCEQRLPAAY